MRNVLHGFRAGRGLLVAGLGVALAAWPVLLFAQNSKSAKPAKSAKTADDDDDDDTASSKDPANQYPGLKGVPLLQSDPLPKTWAPPVPEPPVKGEGEMGAFLQALHNRVHKRWVHSFIRMVQEQLPKTNPLNDPKLQVQMQIVATREGQIVGFGALKKSGIKDMDDAVREIVRDSAPWPVAPNAALSDDGRVYVVWTFARDARMCSGVSVVQRESPLREAVPRLIAQNRLGDAWNRVRAAAATSPEPGLSMYARLWLGRAVKNPQIAPAAAVALLGTGDKSGLDLIRQTVRSGTVEMAPIAAGALLKIGEPLCPLIKENLVKGTGAALEGALAVAAMSPEAECVPPVGAVAANQKNPVPVRMAAIKMLTDSNQASAREALGALSSDPLPGVKAAAMLAAVKPNAGKGAMFKLVPFLRDPAVEMRAAASAGLVRAGGDGALDSLYLLFKETDPRPYELVAAEMSKLSTEATAQFLQRILKRDDPKAHRAAARALAARTDAHARQALAALANDPDPDVKALFTPATAPSPEELGRQALAAPLAVGRTSYRALVGTMAGRPAALAWLLAKFSDLDAVTQAQVLGEWLVPPKAGASVAATRGGG